MDASSDQAQKVVEFQRDSDVFAKGLLQLLQPIVQECDTSMSAVFKSQHQLSDELDELSKELEHFVSIAQKGPPPALLSAVQTLQRAKTRLLALNSTLNVIKERLDRMEKIANTDTNNSLPIPEVFSSLLGKIMTSANPQLQQLQTQVGAQLQQQQQVPVPEPHKTEEKKEATSEVAAAVSTDQKSQ